MNLRWITLFATIAEEGSFTRAAARLNIAQPWLSAQLRKLEYELGVQLLIRENIGVRVTDAGKRLLPHAKQLAESAAIFRETARSLSVKGGLVVNLGSHLPLIDIPALKLLTLEFSGRYDLFEVNTSINWPSELIKELNESSLDLAAIPASLPNVAIELETRSLGRAGVYLLSLKPRKIGSVGDARGERVGIPPAHWMPELHNSLTALLADAGASAAEVAEFDRRAIEHAILTHDTLVAIAIDDLDLEALDPRIQAIRLPGLEVESLLCRIPNRELGRAAQRFWSLQDARLTPTGL